MVGWRGHGRELRKGEGGDKETLRRQAQMRQPRSLLKISAVQAEPCLMDKVSTRRRGEGQESWAGGIECARMKVLSNPETEISLIFQVRKRSLRGGHTTGKWQKLHLNPGLAGSKVPPEPLDHLFPRPQHPLPTSPELNKVQNPDHLPSLWRGCHPCGKASASNPTIRAQHL